MHTTPSSDDLFDALALIAMYEGSSAFMEPVLALRIAGAGLNGLPAYARKSSHE